MPNAIDRERFAFNDETRKRLRAAYHLDGSFVIGHIGRFVPQKNHSFLIQIFRDTLAKLPSARLLLIGDGPLKDDIQKMVQRFGLEEQVIFLGQRNDIPALLQAMDLFLLPSLYEGLPVSCLEAQAAGLSCIAADTVSVETAYEKDFQFLSLASEETWVNAIHRQYERTTHTAGTSMCETGSVIDLHATARLCPPSLPDIRNEARKLTDFYEMRSTDFESIF